MVAQSDNHLVKGCLMGDPQHQKALYDKFKVEMFMVCLRYASDRSEAEDFLQEGFMTVFKDLHQFDFKRGSLQGWVRKVIVNVALQHLRKRRIKYVEAELSEFENSIATQDNVLALLSAKEIVALIQTLPEGYRMVFNLFMIEGYSHKEIAKRLNVSVNTSKTQLRKARLLLQNKVTEMTSV